jgi:hypothetical protein
MTEAELEVLEQGLVRWHSVSVDLANRLVAEIRRLQRELAECSSRS